MDFVLLVLKLCPIQVITSLRLWIKLTMGQLLPFSLCNFSSFFSYVGGILITNHFSLLLIERYILTIQQIITHEEHLRHFFLICNDLLNCLRSLGTMVITTQLAKTASNSFSRSYSSQKVTIFRCFDVWSARPP